MSPTPPAANWVDLLINIQKSGGNGGSNGGGSTSSWSSLVGIITAIVGNILISFALNIQRYAHIRIDREFNETKEDRKSRKKLPKSLRGYGTAVRQEEAAEERARLNATAPGPGHQVDGNDTDEDDERRPLNTSFRSNDSEGEQQQQQQQEKDDDSHHGRKSYLSSPYWWLGIVLMTVGEAGNFLAYGFAPASIVSPLGVVALISNCLIAPLMLKERFRKRDFWGVLVAIGGAVTVVLSAKTSEVKMGPDGLWRAIKRWEFLTYIIITLVFIVVLMFASPRYGRKTILIDLGLVGLFGGYTALSTKGVASMLSDTLWRAFGFPITYVLIAVLILSAVMQIRYINKALSHFDSTQVIPTQFVMFTLSVIIGSAVLYRDFEKTDVDHVIKFVVGCLLTFSGVWLITSGRGDSNEEDEEQTSDEAIRLIDEETPMSEQRTPMKHESQKTNGESNSAADQSESDKDLLVRSRAQSFVPSVKITSYESHGENQGSNPWSSSANDADDTHDTIPRTPPPASRLLSEPDISPFFTSSSLSTQTLRRQELGDRSDSSPANPQTPMRQRRTSSPPKPDPSELAQLETPRSNLFRSARGSFQRLLPGPLVPPLSGSLSALVADSLLKGEGSPQGKAARQSLRRLRSSGRRRSIGPILDVQEPQSAIDPSAMRRWHTRDDVPDTPRTFASDADLDTDSDRVQKRSRLGSFGDTLGNLLRGASFRGKDIEREGNVAGDLSSNNNSSNMSGFGSSSRSVGSRPTTGKRQLTSP